VATPEVTARLAAEVGLRAVELDETPLDLIVDGADEVDLDLTPSRVSAVRWSASASSPPPRDQILLIRAEKLVPALGNRGRLRSEVVRAGVRAGGPAGGGRPFVTDNGNFTLDCETAPLGDPAATKRAIDGIPGVVDAGLFLGTAERALVAEGGRVRDLRRKGS